MCSMLMLPRRAYAAARLCLLLAAPAVAMFGSCEIVVSPLDNRTTGTDYGGPNISVVRVKSSAECCDKCVAQVEPNCTTAIWHNVAQQFCVLKERLGPPFAGNRVAACRPVPCIPPACYPPPPPPAPFRFSSAHSDHMVLQAAPAQAAVWGLCNAGDEVTVHFGGAALPATISTVNGSTVWTAALPATIASFTPATIIAHSKASGTTISLQDVLFGDVWVCSGQSNMAYSLNGSNGNSIVHPPVNNSQAEFADMKNYPHVRLYRAGKQSTSYEMLEPHPNDAGGSTPPIQGWTPPCTEDGICRVDFSSMCYFYGRDIFDGLSRQQKPRPIGLIGTYWGGTADELWSSPDALHKCLDPTKPDPSTDSRLFYGMLSPFLRSTIKGAIWYQGEADAGHPGGKYDGYNCTFPAMIQDWRSKWHTASGGRTSASFPFGFVQLNSIGNASTYDDPAADIERGDLSPAFGYAGLRWSQTASYGFVPNPVQPDVFMAVSYDTPDRPASEPEPHSAGFNVHSPFKQPTAARLARAGLSVAYGLDVGSRGPIPGEITREGQELTLTIKQVGSGAVVLRNTVGFEVLVGGKWASVPATSSSPSSVTLKNVAPAASKLRYNWYSNPCGEHCFGCAVYVTVKPLGKLSGQEAFLPLPPFVTPI